MDDSALAQDTATPAAHTAHKRRRTEPRDSDVRQADTAAKRRGFLCLDELGDFASDDDDNNNGSRVPESRGGFGGEDAAGGDGDDDDGFEIRSSVRVSLEHERRKPRMRDPANCWWLNTASNNGAAARAASAQGQQAGTPYLKRRAKEVRVQATLDTQVVRLVVQGSNVRDGIRQMEAAGMLRADGCHAHTQYEMMAYD